MKRRHNAQVKMLLRVYAEHILELYDFERQLVGLLRQGTKAPMSEELRSMLREHAGQTESHVERLGEILGRLGATPRASHRRDTSHFVTELKRQLRLAGRHPDARHEWGLLSALHKAEAFEVACYATAHSYARLLSFHDDLGPLERNYTEEKEMEERLEQLMGRLKDNSRSAELHMVA